MSNEIPSPVTHAGLLTAAELERLILPDQQVELVRGRLVVSEPPGTRHGAIAANLTYFLMDFVRRNAAGTVFAQDTGFKLTSDPDTVRGPDVAFVSRARLGNVPGRGYAAVAPDLIGEVASPGETPAKQLARVSDFLAAGTRLVWMIDPQRMEAKVFRADGSVNLLRLDDNLDGEDVLPGFICPLRNVVIVE